MCLKTVATLRLFYLIFLKQANKSISVTVCIDRKLKESKAKDKCPCIYEEEIPHI